MAHYAVGALSKLSHDDGTLHQLEPPLPLTSQCAQWSVITKRGVCKVQSPVLFVLCLIWGLCTFQTFSLAKMAHYAVGTLSKLSHDDGTLHQLEPPLPLTSSFTAH